MYRNVALQIHMSASDWFKHGHQNDSDYDILIPMYFIQKVNPFLTRDKQLHSCRNIEKLQEPFLKKPQFIACEKELDSFSNAHWLPCQVVNKLMKTV